MLVHVLQNRSQFTYIHHHCVYIFFFIFRLYLFKFRFYYVVIIFAVKTKNTRNFHEPHCVHIKMNENFISHFDWAEKMKEEIQFGFYYV